MTRSIDSQPTARSNPAGELNSSWGDPRLLLAAIVQSAQDAIIATDLDGTILSWNSGAERMYGYSSDEVTGRAITTLVPAADHDEMRRILERVRSGERVEGRDTMTVRKDGTPMEVTLTLSPVQDDSGQTVAGSVIVRDVTELRRAAQVLRASAHRYR